MKIKKQGKRINLSLTRYETIVMLGGITGMYGHCVMRPKDRITITKMATGLEDIGIISLYGILSQEHKAQRDRLLESCTSKVIN